MSSHLPTLHIFITDVELLQAMRTRDHEFITAQVLIQPLRLPGLGIWGDDWWLGAPGHGDFFWGERSERWHFCWRICFHRIIQLALGFHMGMCQSRAITIQWFGGSDSELGVFIFPFFIPYSMGSEGATNRVSQPANRLALGFIDVHSLENEP